MYSPPVYFQRHAYLFHEYLSFFTSTCTVVVPLRVHPLLLSSFHFDANLNSTNKVKVQVYELRSPN